MPVTSAEIKDVVKNGIADMECGVHHKYRREGTKYGFTLSIITVETLFIFNKNLDILSEQDWINKKIDVTVNSVAAAYIDELNKTKKLNSLLFFCLKIQNAIKINKIILSNLIGFLICVLLIIAQPSG